MALGLTHSRGVNGVMAVESREPGTLEGVSSKAQRDEVAYAILRDGEHYAGNTALISQRIGKDSKFQSVNSVQ